MELKGVVADINEVPEALRPLYVQKGNQWQANLVGDIPGFVKADQVAEINGRLAEFRENNKKVMSALGVTTVDEALQRVGLIAGLSADKLAALKDLDPEAAKAALARVAALEKKGIKNEDDLEVKLKQALDEGLKPIRTELELERKARRDAQERADEALLREVVGTKFSKAGGKAGALDFIVSEFKRDFRVVDGVVKANENKFSPENPNKPLSEDEWVAGAIKRYDFAFAASQGGGASPSSGNGNASLRAGAKELRNPTPQELGRFASDIRKGLIVVVND